MARACRFLSICCAKGLKNAHRHAAGARGDATNSAGSAAAKIDPATADKGPTIIDAHGHGAVVGQIGDTHPRAEGQSAVGSRQTIGVEGLAIGGGVATLIPAGSGHGCIIRQAGR